MPLRYATQVLWTNGWLMFWHMNYCRCKRYSPLVSVQANCCSSVLAARGFAFFCASLSEGCANYRRFSTRSNHQAEAAANDCPRRVKCRLLLCLHEPYSGSAIPKLMFDGINV